MEITKHIPARTVTVRYRWVRREFLVYDQTYRTARAGMRRRLNRCGICNHAFEDGEMMALAAPEGKTNQVLCQTCAGLLLDQAKKEVG